MVHPLKTLLGDELDPLHDTELHLTRWMTGCHGDAEVACEKYREYRNICFSLGLTSPEETLKKYNNARKGIGRFMRSSELTSGWISEVDNGVIFVEMAYSNSAEFLKCMRASEYLSNFFICCEHLQNTILQVEKETGKPSHGICLYDMKDMEYLAHINGLSNIRNLLDRRITIWKNYFSEILGKVIIVNPLYGMSLIFSVIKKVLPAEYSRKFHILSNYPDDLLQFMKLDSIPPAFQGTRRIPDGLEANGCHPSVKVTKEDHIKTDEVWKLSNKNKIETNYKILAHDSLTLEVIPTSTTIVYSLKAKNMIKFTIIQDGHHYLPFFEMRPHLVEDGFLQLNNLNNITIVVNNLTSSSIHVELATAFVEHRKAA